MPAPEKKLIVGVRGDQREPDEAGANANHDPRDFGVFGAPTCDAFPKHGERPANAEIGEQKEDQVDEGVDDLLCERHFSAVTGSAAS